MAGFHLRSTAQRLQERQRPALLSSLLDWILLRLVLATDKRNSRSAADAGYSLRNASIGDSRDARQAG